MVIQVTMILLLTTMELVTQKTIIMIVLLLETMKIVIPMGILNSVILVKTIMMNSSLSLEAILELMFPVKMISAIPMILMVKP